MPAQWSRAISLTEGNAWDPCPTFAATRDREAVHRAATPQCFALPTLLELTTASVTLPGASA